MTKKIVETGERANEIVRSVVTTLKDDDRAGLLAWATELLEIRQSDLPAVRKAEMALRASATTEVAIPLIQALAQQGTKLGMTSKDMLWDQRGWAARVGLAGVTAGTVFFGGQGAGIAALGGAVGVPLWLVLGAGGTVLGTLVDELVRQPGVTTTYSVIEARRVERTTEAPPQIEGQVKKRLKLGRPRRRLTKDDKE